MLRSVTNSRLLCGVLFWAFFTGTDQNRVFAQDVQSNQATRFEIIGSREHKVVIPFDVVNNLIIIQASVNGSVPLKFILDTGVGTTLITTLPENVEIQLTSSRIVTLTGLGEGEGIEAYYSNENTLDIGRIKGKNIEVLFLKENIFKLSSFMGTNVHGIIGYDLFANFAVEINYDNKEIFIYDLDAFEDKFRALPRHWSWYKYPIYIEDKKPYIDVEYKHKEGDPYTKLRLLIDSGSSNAFSLYDLTHPDIKIPNTNIKTLIGVGLSGNVNGYLGRIKEIKLGDFNFIEPVVAYPDSFAIRHAFNLGDRNGSLGGEILRRFKVIFNYRDGYVLVRKNRDYGEKFHYNISGIEINTPIPDLPLYVVSSVRADSPAEKEGIERGDIVKYINGEPVVDMNLNEVINYLQKKQGTRIRLGVQRDSVFKRFNFKLENELITDG